ncbi:hypothetical protein ACIS_00945 [Anaplasma centrale str. Israel]|uniref:Uncharacterized protein n=1 Tax=Anaplasma centrale (strain Israel) TaxID=574556 RepID=D1ASJ5_ANACI|nr:hypothetical protein [Anaplasma centrale]ACZ49448.1 hypothetical protein ACIS_00945 [Anaplasma centrale str. Israel]
MGPKLLRAPSDLGKSLMVDPGCLYKGGDSSSKKYAPSLALLQYMYELAQKLRSNQVITPIDFGGLETASDNLLSDKFVEIAHVIGPPYSNIPKEAWRAMINLVEATPDARPHLPKFLAECFDPQYVRFAKFEVCPFSHFTISAIPQSRGFALHKREVPAYLLEEKVQFKVVNPAGESLGTFTMHTKCTVCRDEKLSNETSVVMKASKPEITITNDLCNNTRRAGHKCEYKPAAKEYKIYLAPPQADGDVSAKCDVTETPTRLLSSDDYMGRIFDGAAGVEYTQRIFQGLFGPILQVHPSDIKIVNHATFLKQSKITHERTLPLLARDREQLSSVEKRAVIGPMNGRYVHAVLRYNVAHKYEIPESHDSSTMIDDLKLYIKVAPDGRGNALFITKDEVDTATFERVQIKKTVGLSTSAAWDDASTAQRCSYTSVALGPRPAHYSASNQDQWSFVTGDQLADSYGRYGVAHPERPLITREGVQRDTLNFLVSQAVYNEAGQNVDPISMEIEKHFVSHRGLVSGSSINTEHEESGSQHRVEEHFILRPKGSKPNNTSLKVHAFVSYLIHGYNWAANEGGRIASLGAKAQLGMRFVNPQFSLDECLQVGDSSIASDSFQVFDIELREDTRIQCNKFRNAILKIDVAKDGALFSSSYRKDGASGGRKEQVKVSDQATTVLDHMALYYGSSASEIRARKEEYTPNGITGPLVPETRALASDAVKKLLRLYDMGAIHVVGRGRGGAASLVRFAPCHSDDLSELSRKRIEFLELLETWIKEIGHQTHTSLFEATINLCGNFSHDGFTQSLLGQFQDRTRFPSKAAIVDKELFLQFEKSTSEDGRPQDKIRVVQHALIAPMAWWQTENVHLVVCYDVCVTQLDSGLRQLQVTHPVAAAKLCSDTTLQAAKPYTSFQLERDHEFKKVRIPNDRVPAPAKALTVMQSAQDHFAGYKYLIQGTSASRGSGQAISEKIRTCIVEFIGLHGIDKLLSSEYISTPACTSDVPAEDYERKRMSARPGIDDAAACYDEAVNILSRANHDKFVKFFCTALGITRVDDSKSEWEGVGTSVFKDRLAPESGGGVAMTHELAFSAKSVVSSTPLNVKVSISYALLHRGTDGGRSFFAMSNPLVRVTMLTRDGRKLGEASLQSNELVPLQTIIEVTSMMDKQHARRQRGSEEQFVRKLQDTAPQQREVSEDHVADEGHPEPAASSTTVTMLSRARDDTESDDYYKSAKHTVDDEDLEEEVSTAPESWDEEPAEHNMEPEDDAVAQRGVIPETEGAGSAEPVHDLSEDIAACLSAAVAEHDATGRKVRSTPGADHSDSDRRSGRSTPKARKRPRSASASLSDTLETRSGHGSDVADELPEVRRGQKRSDYDDDLPAVFEPTRRTASWPVRVIRAIFRVPILIWALIKSIFSWMCKCFTTRSGHGGRTDGLYRYDELRAHGSGPRTRGNSRAPTNSYNDLSVSWISDDSPAEDTPLLGTTSALRSGGKRVTSASNGGERPSRATSTGSGHRRTASNPTTVMDGATTDQLSSHSGSIGRRARM